MDTTATIVLLAAATLLPRTAVCSGWDNVADKTIQISADDLQPIAETIATDGITGFTTYRLSIQVGNAGHNLLNAYTIYGSNKNPVTRASAQTLQSFRCDDQNRSSSLLCRLTAIAP